MTEAEWMAGADPRRMLRSLVMRYHAQEKRGHAVKWEGMRLFGCACCRRVWDLLDSDHRRAIEMIEEYCKRPTSDGLRKARRVR
jgi:hypothetical protein